MTYDKYDVYHLLKKVNEKDLDINLDENTSLPYNVVTDGFGNLYEIPVTGRTPAVSLNDDISVKFSYDWDKRQIDIYILSNDDNYSDVNNYEYVTSYPISAENFLDGPKYWYNVAYTEMQDEIQSQLNDLEVKEAFELYGEIIDDDKDMYKYEIDVNIEFNILDDNYENISLYEKEYADYVSKFSSITSLYGETLKVNSTFDSNSYTLKILVDFPMPLTKEDLLEIYDDNENYFKNISSNAYEINLEIEDIKEI